MGEDMGWRGHVGGAVSDETRVEGLPQVVPMPVVAAGRGRRGLPEMSAGFGLLLALAGIAWGFHAEGARLGLLWQPTAFLVVGLGTLGAVLVQYPAPVVGKACGELREAFFGTEGDRGAMAALLVRFARQARRQGVMSLEGELDGMEDGFLRRGLTLAVDGVGAEELRGILEREMEAQREQAERSSEVFETAGGSAPTIGILGAVLGLIHVMQLLGNVDEVGRGIAAAFVSTLYGVGAANLLLLPLAGKLRMRAQAAELRRMMMVEGVVSISEGVMPRALEVRLGGYYAGPAAGARMQRAAEKAMAG